jgi:hypothetical protein
MMLVMNRHPDLKAAQACHRVERSEVGREALPLIVLAVFAGGAVRFGLGRWSGKRWLFGVETIYYWLKDSSPPLSDR